MPRRNFATSKSVTPNTTLPRYREVQHNHQHCCSPDDDDDDNQKTLRSTIRIPSSNAEAILCARQCVHDSSFTNYYSVSIMLLIFVTLVLVLFVEDHQNGPSSSTSPRRLANGLFKGTSSRRYRLTQPRILFIDPLKDYKLQTDKEQAEAATATASASQSSFGTNRIYVSETAQEAQKQLKNSKKYGTHQIRDPMRKGDCEPMRWWQEASFPSCNKVHEMHLMESSSSQFKFIANGSHNSVFVIKDVDGSEHVVKILQYNKDTDYTDRNFDRVRRDSLIMERATRSPYVLDIYSYCGFSQVVEFGKEGDLDDLIYDYHRELESYQKIQIAVQVTQGLTDVHDIDGDGISSISHSDFASKQYILIDGRFKLSDFNVGRLLGWNPKLKEPCPYTVGNNDSKFRSPEEYKYLPETAAVDVWALGSLFVEVLTGSYVWHGYKAEPARAEIFKGNLPPAVLAFQDSTDPVDQVLFKAIKLCYVYDPKDRPKAGVVLEFLKEEATKLGVDWHAPFVFDMSSSVES
eukprot:scaffold8600_cov111-Cylindrotheca_fusiformis.AAC.8